MSNNITLVIFHYTGSYLRPQNREHNSYSEDHGGNTLNAKKPIEIYIQNHSFCVVYHAIKMSSGLTNNGAVLIANLGLEKKNRKFVALICYRENKLVRQIYTARQYRITELSKC